MIDTRDIEMFKKILENAENVVFFGGAGVSTESGIPDFRGSSGLYEENYGNISPEEILSRSFFFSHTDKFYEFYRSKMIYHAAKPNEAHRALAKLEQDGKLSAVITQNIDGLHQLAGSQNVIELHGTSLKNTCLGCGREYPLSSVLSATGIPRCEVCGKPIKPNVILYGEGLDASAIDAAQEAIYYADVLIVGGTSLRVEPAASLARSFEGEHLIIINETPTSLDGCAELVFREPIGEVLSEVVFG